MINFATGLELVAKSHPAEFNPTASQALTKVREQVAGRSDRPLSDLKAALCRLPYGLTESMVTLYVFALIKSGGFELALNPNAGVTLSDGRLLPGDRLTAHTLPLCEWNARLDRALLGSRLVESLHKGWNEVLPYARILDPDLKPATTPDEEQARNESLLERLAQLQSEIPEVDKSLVDLASVLNSSMPSSLKEVLARYRGLATAAVTTDLKVLDAALWVCPDAVEAAVAGKDALCPRCQWHPGTKSDMPEPLDNSMLLARVKSRLRGIYGDPLHGVVVHESEARGEEIPRQ